MNVQERVLETLVADGTLSPAQAGAVRDGLAAERSRRRPRVGEAAGYLGGALALVSALTVASQFWADLRPGAQSALLALAGLVLWAVGHWAREGELETSTSRLSGLLWLLSVPAIGEAARIAVLSRPEATDALAWLAGGGAAAVWGLGLWRARRGALQQLPTFGALLVVLVAGLEVLVTSTADSILGAFFGLLGNEWAALLVWIAGCVWAVLAWGGWVPPRRAGYVLGGLAALGGAQWLSFIREGPGLALGAVTVVSLLVAAVLLAQRALLGLATAGAAVFAPQILQELFPEALTGPAVTFVAGVVLLAGGLATMRVVREEVSDGR